MQVSSQIKMFCPYITRLNFGQTQLSTSSGVHTLGRFECSGSVALNGLPASCEDLWLIGHTLNGFYSVFIWTGILSVWLWMKRETPSLVKTVRLRSSRRRIWKKAIKFGWRFITQQQGRGCMTIVPTLLISRDLCWKRKLWRHFEDVRFYFDYPLVHILEIPIYYMIDIQLSKKMNIIL